ncbi:MAG TPA: S8 family serine peptidase [Candidatus Eisenbacteria bacterium]|nr:S8 family serine peptidase [Candidatus Eisenbacteria bacterium]
MSRPTRYARPTAALTAFLFFLCSQMPVWAAFEPRRSDEQLYGQGRDANSLQDSFLKKTRLLQQKQEIEQLQEELQAAAQRQATVKPAGKPGGNPPPPGTSYPNDPYYNSSDTWGQGYADEWGVKKIGLDASVWNLYKGAGVTIGIVDTGLIFGHEDLAGNVWQNSLELNGVAGVDDDGDGYVDDVRGWDFVDNDNNPTDLNGHGSHVAGIAAAVGNNSKGIIGVAPLAKVMGVRVLDRNGSGTLQAVADGIRYAARAGAQVINLSLGAANLDAGSLSLLQGAVDYAVSLGRIIVAAAGNSNANVDTFSPANLNNVIAVGATDAYDTRASFSNYGSKLFISAPGVDILSLGSRLVNIGTKVTNDYYRASGTSMASPFVTGAVALLLNKYPSATLSEIRTLLANGATDLGATGWDPYYGYGRLNIAASLGLAGSTATYSGVSSSGYSAGSGLTLSVSGPEGEAPVYFLKRRLDDELLLGPVS